MTAEFDLIRRYFSRPPRSAVLGVGDDCALVRPPAGHDLLVTTDFSLEGIHFRRDWHPADSVGHRCLARGLSDIAAMGGEPLAAFLSLALPAELEQKIAEQNQLMASLIEQNEALSAQLTKLNKEMTDMRQKQAAAAKEGEK